MTKQIIIITAIVAMCLGMSSCIEETLPTQFVLDSQIRESDAALDGMVNSIYTTMAGYSNADGGIEVISYGSLRALIEHSTTQMVCVGANGYNTMGAWAYGAVSAAGSNRGIYP